MREPVENTFGRVGEALCAMLRQALSPWPVGEAENIALDTPAHTDGNCRLGVFLYDLQEFTTLSPGRFRYDAAGERVTPLPVPFELSYMLYCNEAQSFGGRPLGEDHRLLAAAADAVCLHGALPLEGQSEPVTLRFARLEFAQKTQLWSSFQRALQPALYLVAAPVLEAPGRRETAPRVRTVEVKGGRKNE